jgi:hypothetical protein
MRNMLWETQTAVADTGRGELAGPLTQTEYRRPKTQPARTSLGCLVIPWEAAQAVADQYQLLRDTLIDVVVGFKRYFDFSGYYNSYVSGQLSEGAFEKVAKTYSVQDGGDDEVLAEKIECLLRESGAVLYSNELAQIFSVPERQVERVMARLSTRGQIGTHDQVSLPRPRG